MTSGERQATTGCVTTVIRINAAICNIDHADREALAHYLTTLP